MAVRLSVIMVHTPPASAAMQSLSEDVVGQLIGLPGIDVALIGPVRTLVAESTDRLTLDTISGDVAMLDWQDPEQTIADLASVGFSGARAAHTNDPHPPQNGSPLRRIYTFDLTRFSDAAEVVQALVELRDHRRVKTLSIGLSPPPKPAATGTSHSNRNPDDSSTSGGPIPEKNGVSQVASSPPTADPPSSSKQENDRPGRTGTQPIDLDQLIDQLDELDP